VTGSVGSTTTLTSAGRGAQGWNVIDTVVQTRPNLSLAEGAAYSAASNGLISPTTAATVGKVLGPISKAAAPVAAVGAGLELGVLGACR